MLRITMINQFEQAIIQYKMHSSSLLTLGEQSVLKTWSHLSVGAKQLYIFLFHRKPAQFRREHIRYVDAEKDYYFDNIREEENAIESLNNIDWSFNAKTFYEPSYFWIVYENLKYKSYVKF